MSTLLRRITAPPVSEFPSVSEVLFGLAFPIVCLVLGFAIGIEHLLGGVIWFIATAAGISFLALLIWFLYHPFSPVLTSLLSSIFFIAAAGAGMIGLVLLPTSVVGLLLCGLGLLGLIPFATAIVFFRNGVRAYNESRLRISDAGFRATWFCGILLVFIIPAGIESGARFLRPELVHPPLYPNSQDIVVGPFDVINSGTAYEQMTTFFTHDSPEMVARFYEVDLSARGWSEKFGGYSYASATGKGYLLYIRSEKTADQRTKVTLSLQRNRGFFD